jgi:hypothetical protein
MTSRRDLLSQARQLSARLAAGGVKRSELRHSIDVLLHSPGTWDKRKAAALQLLTLAPTSNLADRSGRTPDQLTLVNRLVSPILQASQSEEDTRFLLVWTARMLTMRENHLQPPAEPSAASYGS